MCTCAILKSESSILPGGRKEGEGAGWRGGLYTKEVCCVYLQFASSWTLANVGAVLQGVQPVLKLRNFWSCSTFALHNQRPLLLITYSTVRYSTVQRYIAWPDRICIDGKLNERRWREPGKWRRFSRLYLHGDDKPEIFIRILKLIGHNLFWLWW